MQYNEVKRMLLKCPDLAFLDEASRASLFWRGDEITLGVGTIVYAEGASLDDNFCLLLAGDLLVAKGAIVVGRITEQSLFGEMAYFTRLKERTATVQVDSPQATVLKIQLTPTELGSASFSILKRYLGLQAWERFVSTSKSNP